MTSTLDIAAAACETGNLDELRSLLGSNADLINDKNAHGDTLLGLACRAATGQVALPPVPGTPGQHAAVDMILASGADPNAANDEGWTPLHTAAMVGHHDLATRLLAAGASRSGHLYGCSGGSPLSLALFYAKTDTAELLANPAVPDNLRSAAGLGRDLDRFFASDDLTAAAAIGADFYRPLLIFPEWERTYAPQELLDEALTWAARNSQLIAMDALLARGADVDSNAYRGTPLLWSVYNNRADATLWLLEHGANPNLQHDFGGDGHGVNATATHLAAQNDSIDSLRVLLKHGADPDIRDDAYDGTALGWAEFSNAQASIQLLKAH